MAFVTARKELGCAYAAASKLIEGFAELRIPEETTNRQLSRRYSCKPRPDLSERQLIPEPYGREDGAVPTSVTCVICIV